MQMSASNEASDITALITRSARNERNDNAAHVGPARCRILSQLRDGMRNSIFVRGAINKRSSLNTRFDLFSFATRGADHSYRGHQLMNHLKR